MAIGVTGALGQPVVSHVMRAPSKGQEHATIQLHNLVEKTVLEKQQKIDFAALKIVQVMLFMILTVYTC